MRTFMSVLSERADAANASPLWHARNSRAQVAIIGKDASKERAGAATWEAGERTGSFER